MGRGLGGGEHRQFFRPGLGQVLDNVNPVPAPRPLPLRVYAVPLLPLLRLAQLLLLHNRFLLYRFLRFLQQCRFVKSRIKFDSSYKFEESLEIKHRWSQGWDGKGCLKAGLQAVSFFFRKHIVGESNTWGKF